jgi:UDP-N-acetylglucosamine 1-carboxyvinyltransferase
MSMLLAALCAKGTSTVKNANIIDRGYEQTELQLRRLGAKIRRK